MILRVRKTLHMTIAQILNVVVIMTGFLFVVAGASLKSTREL